MGINFNPLNPATWFPGVPTNDGVSLGGGVTVGPSTEVVGGHATVNPDYLPEAPTTEGSAKDEEIKRLEKEIAIVEKDIEVAGPFFSKDLRAKLDGLYDDLSRVKSISEDHLDEGAGVVAAQRELDQANADFRAALEAQDPEAVTAAGRALQEASAAYDAAVKANNAAAGSSGTSGTGESIFDKVGDVVGDVVDKVKTVGKDIYQHAKEKQEAAAAAAQPDLGAAPPPTTGTIAETTVTVEPGDYIYKLAGEHIRSEYSANAGRDPTEQEVLNYQQVATDYNTRSDQNPEGFEDPNLIYPGDTVRLPPIQYDLPAPPPPPSASGAAPMPVVRAKDITPGHTPV